jgi:hypothetical protein
MGLNHANSMLTASNGSAQCLGLAKRQKGVAGQAARRHGIPEVEDVDAAIGSAADGVVRQAHRSSHAVPRLYPRHAPDFKFADNSLGDLVVKIGPVGPARDLIA